jgi:peptidoglycan/xylan/chitin deacetylase (PgdA/CDA1 family)
MTKTRREQLLDRVVRQSIKAAATAADPLFGRLGGPRLLVYHQIEAGLGREMEVPLRTFERQIEWLQANTEIVDLDTAIARRDQPDAHRLVVLTFDDGYDDMYRFAYPLLESGRIPFTVYLTTHPTETGEPLFADERARPCTWDQVEVMASSGLMTLGAHTHRHPDLTAIGVDEIEPDLTESNRLIEDRLGVRPVHFCYPYGWWSENAHRHVATMYETATLGSGAAFGADTDLLKINRVPVQLADGMFFFKRKVRMGLQLEDRLRRRFKGYDGP